MTDAFSRRDFIKRAALTTGSMSVSMAGFSSTKVIGANDRIRVGVIGAGSMGVHDMKTFIRCGAQVAAICDVYQPNLQKALAEAGGKARTYQDFRGVLDDKDVDVVIIATPDHWHAVATVEACKAGKDVYVEKPVCVAVEEGQKMVAAARAHRRIVQVGLWQRSNAHFQKAVELVQSGVLGKVSYARTWNYANKYPEGDGSPADSDPPPGLNWDLWLGPAPKVPYNFNRFGVMEGRWSTFRYFYDYANGWPGDWGVHLMDVVQWAMKVEGPSGITATGTKRLIKDNTDVPDTLQITWEYPNFVATYENRLCNTHAPGGRAYGIEFYGTDATMFVDRGGLEAFPEPLPKSAIEQLHGPAKEKAASGSLGKAPAIKMEQVDDGLYNHVSNLLDCMRARVHPQSDIEYGHRSTSTCVLGNIALRTGEQLKWDVANQALLKGGPAAQKLLRREYRAPWKLEVQSS